MSEFYKMVTEKVEVTVRPEFVDLGLQEAGAFLWRYFIKIKNNGPETIQILRRYWRIVNEDGSIEEVFGEGVVGKKPILVPQLEFEYDSQVKLKYPSGIMGGYFEAKTNSGHIIRIKIPSFSLDIPHKKQVIN